MDSPIDRLDTMTIRAASADQQIQVTLSGGHDIAVRFRPGAYEKYRERVLEQQLARLGTGVWTGFRRGYLQAVSQATGVEPRADSAGDDPKRRAFQEARARLLVSAESPRGTVRVESVGLVRWRVDIKDGALGRLTEQQFLGELTGAVKAMIADYNTKMRKLKDRIFDLNLESKDRWFGRSSR